MGSATIVIPQYGCSELTIRCVRSLRKFDTREWPIRIVSDGCETAEVEMLRQKLGDDQKLEILTQPHRGITAAWNLGARNARTESVVFLNNDVVCRGEWGERFLKPLVAGEKLCGVGLRTERLPLVSGPGAVRLKFFQGWCLGISRSWFERLQGFDERLALYWSDTDFQMRTAMALGGWDWLPRGLVSELPLLHLGHRTTRHELRREDCRDQWYRDREAFGEKWERMLTTRSDFSWEQYADTAAGL
ncbi:MAG: glycosyltransferase [Planctomycetales bacterium]